MLNTISKLLEKPPIYTKTEIPFWDDEHISRQMLKAHLDPDFEGASRKLKFIEESAAWIRDTVPPSAYPCLLDIGCGPGIYAERFSRMGYRVTGIDFSKRSIEYAGKSAGRMGLNIDYRYQNYLNMDIDQLYDVSTMIYCDYGALSAADRKILMYNVYNHLRPGGIFLLDVFSMVKYNSFEEKQTWEICPDGGFWRKDKYIAVNGCYRYPDHVTLEQTAVISEGTAAVYYLWNCYFTRESLAEEAEEAGFKVRGVFGDVAGSPWEIGCPAIAILLEK